MRPLLVSHTCDASDLAPHLSAEVFAGLRMYALTERDFATTTLVSVMSLAPFVSGVVRRVLHTTSIHIDYLPTVPAN